MQGTGIAAPIVPLGPFEAGSTQDIKGGPKQYATIADRDADLLARPWLFVPGLIATVTSDPNPDNNRPWELRAGGGWRDSNENAADTGAAAGAASGLAAVQPIREATELARDQAQAAADTTAATVANAAVQAASVTALVAAWTAAGAGEGTQGVVYTIGPEEGVYRRLSGVPVRVGDTQRQVDARVTIREAQIDAGELTARGTSAAQDTRAVSGRRWHGLPAGDRRAYSLSARINGALRDLLRVDTARQSVELSSLDTPEARIPALTVTRTDQPAGARVQSVDSIVTRIGTALRYPWGLYLGARRIARLDAAASRVELSGVGVTTDGAVTAASVSTPALTATAATVTTQTADASTTGTHEVASGAATLLRQGVTELVRVARNKRRAWGIGGVRPILTADTIDNALAYSAPLADYRIGPAAMVEVAGQYVRRAPSVRKRFRGPMLPPLVLQGSAMRPLAARTHAMIPSVAIDPATGRRFVVQFNWDGVPAQSYGEQPGSYLSVYMSERNSGVWSEIFQIVARDFVRDRLFDPQIVYVNGTIQLLYCYSGGSEPLDGYQQVWCSVLNNPGSLAKWDVSPAQFVVHGCPSRPWMHNGELFGTVDVWRNWYITGSNQYQRERAETDLGVHFGRWILQGRGAPFFEKIARIPDVAPEIRQYTETQTARLSDGRMWALRRTELGLYQSWSSGQFATDWTDPVPFTAYGSTPSSRASMRNTPGGRIALITGYNTTSRTAMTVGLSEDDGMTFPHRLLLDSRALVSYSTLEFDGDTMCMTWDRERGQQASQVKDILYTEVSETALAAGTASAPTLQIVSQ